VNLTNIPTVLRSALALLVHKTRGFKAEGCVQSGILLGATLQPSWDNVW